MKSLIIAAFAAAAISTVASAADLPATSGVSVSDVELEPTNEIQHIISGSFTTNFESNSYSEISDLDYTFGYRYLGIGNGVSVGGSLVSSSSTDISDLEAKRVEADINFSQSVGLGVSSNIGGGLGYRLEEDDFYYKINTGFDYKVSEAVTLNAFNYQFRDTTDNTWRSHEVSTGVTFNVVENISVSGRIARVFDEDLNADNDSVTLGASFGF